MTVFVERSSTKECYHQPPAPQIWKQLSAVPAPAPLPDQFTFSSLTCAYKCQNVMIFKLCSTKEQMALVVLEDNKVEQFILY
jgi:hypothetical protein